MKARALRSLLSLVLPFAALACGSNVTVDDLFGSSTGGTGSSSGAGGAQPTTSGGGATPTTSGTDPWTSTGSTGTGTGTGSSTGTGSTGTGSGTGGGMPDPICPSFGDPCTSCMSTDCAATYCGCFDNPDCLDLLKCTGGCGGDEACRDECLAEHPDGIGAALLLGDCAATVCDASCSWGTPVDPCQSCLATDCSSEYGACLGDTACVGLYKCLTGCGGGDLVCQQGCYDEHGDGVVPLQALLDCSKTDCPAACN